MKRQTDPYGKAMKKQTNICLAGKALGKGLGGSLLRAWRPL